MTNRGTLSAIAAVVVLLAAGQAMSQQTLSRSAFVDKLEGGWVGQMAGVAWGRTTEAQYQNTWIPDAQVPAWSPQMVNQAFSQDDLYVEMPFIDAMVNEGVNCSWGAFGEYFKNTTFPLWVANKIGRDNLLAGIPVPDSGHPRNNFYYAMIDWQIESNFAGAISPALPTAAGDIAWRGGHVMNWGDGVYGGVCFAVMQAVAYTATDVNDIIRAGRDCLPPGSGYRELVDDMIGWYQADADKTTWLDTWQLAQNKWGAGYWYDAKINGAWMWMGLLYGREDIEKAMRISMRGGDDSDCNLSSVGAIIGTYLGLSGIPDKYKSALDRTATVFSNSGYTFNGAIAACESLARQAVLLRGGTIVGDGGDELWTIPADTVAPLPLETWPGSGDDVPLVSISLQRDQAEWNKITLDATASDGDGIASVHWFCGDLTFHAGESLTHTYNARGRYEIIAYATDGGGNTGWASVTVSLYPGDLNRSGGVDIVDLNMVLIDWGKTGGFVDPRSDADGDGTVDIVDLNTVLIDWGQDRIPAVNN